MIRKIIAVIIIAVIIIIGWRVVDYTLHRKTARFNLHGSGYTVVITNNNGRKIKEITSSSDVSLQEGEYLYSINGSGYLNQSIPFIVDKNMKEITITPSHSQSSMQKISQDEQEDIKSLIIRKYSSLGNISVADITLHPTGAWASGTLIFVDTPGDIYRFIVEKEGDHWKVVVTPTIAISKNDVPKDVPIDFIYNLYSQASMNEEKMDDETDN